MMKKNKEDQVIINRIKDLARTAYKRHSITYSDFLNLNQQSLFYGIENNLGQVKSYFFGGYKNAERQIICFSGNDYISKDDIQSDMELFPLGCIKITAKHIKFSDDLNHRDYLGALISLGIDRSTLGDIVVLDDCAYLICHKTIKEFIINNLIKIKHTNVCCESYPITDFDYEPQFKLITGIVSSIRLDSILAIAFQSSRSKTSKYISGGRVFINGKTILSNSYLLEDKDLVSVRGKGKFAYMGIDYKTKKDRLAVNLHLYI